MAGLSVERPGWQVRIRRRRDAEPVGAGVLVSDTHVVTCAHVVASGHVAPGDPVFVEFQFAARHEPIPASVIEGGWWPQYPDGGGDVAVLALSGALPAGATPAPLREAESAAEHSFRAYGYPKGHERNGVWSRGLIVGPAEVEWVQLEVAGTQGFSLLQGFSGTPIWDDDLGAVVGIVVSTDREVDVRTGYGIPIEVIGRYWAGLSPWVGWRLSHDPAMASHWGPRARGVERDSRPGWYFTGRRQALAELVVWMEHERADGAIRVVTGGPGSGKSAVLARLVALADPDYRVRIEAEDPAQLEDAALVPSVGRVSVAVHAAGLDVGEATGKIAAAISTVAGDPNVLIAQVCQRDQSLVVVIDALDEAVTATEARAIATKLLVPLARDTADIGVKVLVGTRAGPDGMLLRALGSRARVIDLDLPRYFEIADLAGYTARSLCLEFDPTSASPYRSDAEATAVVSRAIAEAAFPSFLVAGLTARARAEDPEVIDASVPGWQTQAAFPADVDMAMADYLDRLGDPQRAFDLLVPVAYARYPGLPRDSLWALLAEAYAGKPYGPADIDWLVATAASFLLDETGDAGVPVVRLFHQALVDHVRSRTQSSLVEQAFIGVLASRAEAAGGWLHAERYARLHAASHAARAGGGLLDRLVADPAFLVAAERRGLLRALPRLVDPGGRRAANCYRTAAAAGLSGDAAADAAYLELASRIEQNEVLADAIRNLRLPQPFTTVFGQGRSSDDVLPPTGHTGGVRAVEWGSLDRAPVLASAGLDGTVRLWDPADGRQLRVLEGHTGGVSGLSWSLVKGAPVLASAGLDATVRLWDPADGRQLQVLEGHTAGVWTVAAGRLEGAPVLASAGTDETVRLWDAGNGVQLRVLEGHTSWVLDVEWGSLDGVTLLASAGLDGTVRLWDPAYGVQLRVLEGHTGGVWAVVWGTLEGMPVLASTGDDAMVRLWDPVDGRQLRVLEGHIGPVWSVAWGSLDGAPVLASSGLDGIVRLWDPDTGTQLRALKGHTAGIPMVAWGSLDGAPVLASASFDAEPRLWDPADGRQLRVLEGHISGIWGLAWGSLDGAPVLASAGFDGTVRLWDPDDGRQRCVLEGHTGWVRALAWADLHGSPVLASAGFDGTVRLWDPVDGRPLRVLEGQIGGVWGLAWGSLDGAPVLASAGLDGTVRLWDPEAGTQLRVLEDQAAGARGVVWGMMNGAPVLASSGDDATVRLWDPVDGRQLRVLEGHVSAVWGLAWGTQDGAPVLASAGLDGTVRLWDPEAGTQLRVMEGHTGAVWTMSWERVRGASILTCACIDGTVLWDPEGSRVGVINFVSGVHTATLNPDGWLAIAGWEGLAVLGIGGEVFANPQTARRWSLPGSRPQQPPATEVTTQVLMSAEGAQALGVSAPRR